MCTFPTLMCRWGTNATIEDWFDEMVGQANIINRFKLCLAFQFIFLFAYNIDGRFGGVDMEDIRGLRVPFLSTGWNRSFTKVNSS